jgi:quinol monooxygenase YgiN
MSDHVLVVAENTINVGQVNNLKALVEEMINAIKHDEPGTLNYEWFITEDGTSVHVYERYINSEAYLIHLENFGQKYAERCFTYLTVTNIAIYGNPSDKVREVFKAYDPVYMSPFAGIAR